MARSPPTAGGDDLKEAAPSLPERLTGRARPPYEALSLAYPRRYPETGLGGR